jgi:hypothetical protein
MSCVRRFAPLSLGVMALFLRGALPVVDLRISMRRR